VSGGFYRLRHRLIGQEKLAGTISAGELCEKTLAEKMAGKTRGLAEWVGKYGGIVEWEKGRGSNFPLKIST
jgi:hypothetical protein